VPVEEHLVHRLDDRVEAGVLVVDVEARMRLARCRYAQAREQRHAEPLVQVAGILDVVAQYDGLQPEKLLPLVEQVEVDPQAGFVAAAAAGAAGPNPDVLDPLIAPREVRGVVGVQLVVSLEIAPIPRVHREPDGVELRVVEEGGGVRGHRSLRPGGRRRLEQRDGHQQH
jgi:hypothetical protein